jgi:hypothetical protein
MKTRSFLSALAALATTFAVSGSAHAVMIAGWDFSQYFTSGELSIDAATYTDTLDANYSNLLGAPGAGPAASSYGTFFYNGEYGSTDVVEDSPTALITPASGSLNSNITAPQTGVGFVPFNSFTTLDAAGQEFEENLSLQIQNNVSFVFAAYLDTIPGLVSDWSLSFGGQTLSGTSIVDIAFSTNGTTFTSAGSRTLNTLDTLYTITLAGLPSDTAFVRLSVNTAGGVGSRIDNVSINGTVVPVPLPSVAILLGTALAAFATVGRRKA